MIACNRGDVVLVGFVFSDQAGKKTRPVVVISTGAYHRSRQDAVVAAVASNVKRRLLGDHPVTEWREAGLLFPSVVTGVIRTVQRTMIERKLGSLAAADLESYESGLRRCLGL